jgi:peroxiredoxin
MKKYLLGLVLACLCCSAAAQATLEWKENPALQRIRLKKSEGGSYKLGNIHEHAATVVVFLSPECPLSETYTLTLRELHSRYKEDQIGFYGVVPGKDISPADIERFRKTYQLDFPLLLDMDYALCGVLQPKVTPEVFLLDPWGGVKYRGAIDDRVEALGKLKAVASAEYLNEALEKWLMTEPFWPIETTAIGCLIEMPQ